MLSRYDATQAARVDCEFARKYDTVQAARVDCEFARAYDDTEAAWVDKLKKLLELSVTDNFYNSSGNIVHFYGTDFHCEVKPTSSDILITAILEKEFKNPVISCEYSMGNSDLCPDIAADYRSHSCIEWHVKGYLNGAEMASSNIVYGASYAYTTVYNESKTLTLNGTFDKLEFICLVNAYSNFSDFGKANTTLSDITVDGKLYDCKAVLNA